MTLPPSFVNRQTMQSTRLRLRVTATAETVLRGGHPWVFADSIRDQNRQGACGELAVIYDRRDRFLAIGFYDPASPIRVRVLQAGNPAVLDGAWWLARLAQAVERRRGLFDERTTGYRWINGESDGWPGLVLDRYDATLVLKVYTAAWLPRLAEVTALFWAQLNPERIILRMSRNLDRLRDRGKASPGGSPVETAGTSRVRDGELLRGPPLEGPVVFQETGLRFEADVVRGQKTGFFLDQRENRRGVESLSGGRRVLNAFSFSGGFSLYAARGGAVSVTDLDISAHALAGAETQCCPERLGPVRGALCARKRAGGRMGLAASRPAAAVRFDCPRPAIVCETGSRAAGGRPRLRKTRGTGDPAAGARGNSRRLLLLGPRHRGGILRGGAPQRGGVQTILQRAADGGPSAGSSGGIPGGGLFEGDLPEAVTAA